MKQNSVQATANDRIPSVDELLDRAKALGPVLRERARQCEELGKVPSETVQDFQDAGFYRILQPKAYGGFEHLPRVFYCVLRELARHCPSSAWALGVIGAHNWEAGLMDPRVAEDLWGEDSNVRFSSSYAPFGKAKRVEGGYVLEGRWSWSSGCDHATWVILGAVVEMENGEANQLALMVGPGDYEIDHSSWDFAGLSGTGSKDVTVNGAFIPCYRVHNINESYLMTEPGRAAFTADTYKLPFGTVFGLTLTSVMVGMAEGAFDFYVDYVSKRTSAYTGASFKEDPLAQQVLAEAHSLVDGAVLRLNRDADEMANYAVRGEKVPLNRRVFYKWDAANIVRQCRDAVNLLTANSGGSMFNRSCIMQRYFRDINTGSNHLFVNPQKGSVNFARFMLGGENQDLMI